MISWDINFATIMAIAAQFVGFIVYLVRTDGKARGAYRMASQAVKRADEAHEKIVVQQAALGMFREHVASRYIDRDALSDTEVRLMDALKQLTARIDRLLEKRE